MQVISYSTTEITQRLDRGRKIGEQFAKIGIIIATISAVITPLGLVTSYYGMNVKEFTNDSGLPLFEVWKVGAPVLLVVMVSSGFITLWAGTWRN